MNINKKKCLLLIHQYSLLENFMVMFFFHPFQELEDYRSTAKSAVHEKLVAIARAKELMRQEHQSEIERIVEQMRNVCVLFFQLLYSQTCANGHLL